MWIFWAMLSKEILVLGSKLANIRLYAESKKYCSKIGVQKEAAV